MRFGDGSKPFQVVTTVNSKEKAEEIALKALERRLAACVQIYPIDSMYHWEGKIERDKEWLIQFKTLSNLLGELKELIKAEHPYEVPELIAYPIEVLNEGYLKWMMDELNSKRQG